jgi:arylsulfatase A-like enzyme
LGIANHSQVICPVFAGTADSARRPNIVLILADDLGYGDLPSYGAAETKTPNLDRLAREGLRFTDFHANAASCSPTRAALLTGRYQQRSGVESALSEKSPGLRGDALTIAEYLKPAGYATGVFGKWHLGSRPDSPALPNRRGFDEFVGARHGGIDYHSHVDRYGRLDWWRNEEQLDEPGYATDLLTKHAVRFIETHRDRPFFLYLPHLAIHFPWMTPEDGGYRRVGGDYDNLSKVGPHAPPDLRPVVRRMVERLDDGVGEVVAALRKHGLAENTLVVFTSDNGGYLRYSGGFLKISSNGVLRGQKIGMHEGGHRVPCIAWWPGRIAAGTTTDATTITMDLLPTYLELLGIAPPPAGDPHALDGVSLAPLLFKNEAPAERTLFWRTGDFKAVRQGPWKLVIEHGERAKLYRLDRDLSEKQDLAGMEPERLSELEAALAEWERDVDR